MPEMENESTGTRTGLEVAVIGMAGRYPGAGNIDAMWENVKNGVESVIFPTDEELMEFGVGIQALENPMMVKASSNLDNVEYFDASFFNYTPTEAQSLDPQVRIMHECVWEALEHAGIVPDPQKHTIGLYAGAGPNYTWELASALAMQAGDMAGRFGVSTLNNKDLLTTRISYALDLSGPSITLYTACSTSLVAIDQAYRSILTGQCDIALAGGIAVYYPKRLVNMYQEGMIFTPDGHTRAFDAMGKGSMFGEGVGVVVLKSLEDAISDRDYIHAVIRGSASNNDGAQKISYSAVGISGQTAVISSALHMAGVDPEHIGFIEAHGTATPMGDPVEIEALTNAFNTEKKGYCAVASIKSNMGHLDVSAGVTGFIRTVMALKHRQIPPSLFFETPNPRIDFENSPFYVNTELKEWKRENNRPLLAGVESFGVGGCNAHVVLEEWIPGPEFTQRSRNRTGDNDRQHLLILSARSETALENSSRNLADHIRNNPQMELEDVAYTLQVGRKAFQYRRMLACTSLDEAAELLESGDTSKVKTFCCDRTNPPVVFMFAGLGAQYVDMGKGLYQSQPIFREAMDTCFQELKTIIPLDIKSILYPEPGMEAEAKSRIDEPEISQLAVFMFEYSLAQLLMGWGIKPKAMIGYSFGEYAAACVSGVFSLADGLQLVVNRGRLIQGLPEGSMLSIPLPRDQVTPILAVNPDVSLAIDNGPSCIVAGPVDAVAAVVAQLKEKKIMSMPVPANRALHSTMMDPIFDDFKAVLAGITLNKPNIPYIGNVTGNWVSEEDAVNPEYWIKHLGRTVQFADGMRELLKDRHSVFVEIGPGRDISALAGRHFEDHPDGGHRVLNLIRHPNQKMDDTYLFLNKIGRLWFWGISIDWEKLHHPNQPFRVPLPTYPFEGKPYWVDQKILETMGAGSGADTAPTADYCEWFYIENWTRDHSISTSDLKQESIDQESIDQETSGQETSEEEETGPGSCLVFANDGCPFAAALTGQLEDNGYPVIVVKPGSCFVQETGGTYTIDPQASKDYKTLFSQLAEKNSIPTRMVHMWGITGASNPGEASVDDPTEPTLEGFDQEQIMGFYSLLHTARAIDKEKAFDDVHITVITDRVQSVTGEEPLNPGKITVLSPVMVIPQEFPAIRCRSIDVVVPKSGSVQEESLLQRLLVEIETGTGNRETMVAYRGNHRWVQTFDRQHLGKPEASNSNPKLKQNGVYFLTGGLGTIGGHISQFLAEHFSAKLILTGRTVMPPKEEWDRYLEDHKENDRISTKIRKVKKIEALGAEVLVVSADAADEQQMKDALQQGEDAFGPIDGIVYLPGIVKGETFASIRGIRDRHCREQFHPKVKGILVLSKLIGDRDLDFCWIMSSLSSVLGGLGFVAYAAANIYLDAFVKLHNQNHRCKWFSVDWEDEQFEETQNGFDRILRLENAQQIVFCRGGKLHQMLDQWIKLETMTDSEEEEEDTERARQPRPDLMNPYVAPETENQQQLAEIWRNLLGFEEVGIDDDFLELGGDSLKAITLITRVHKELSVSIPLTDFFENPTIAFMSTFLESGETDTFHAIMPAEKKEYYPLASAQKRIYILQQMEEGSTNYNETMIMPLNGTCVPEEFETTALKLLERHEGLRTSFRLVDDEPMQVINEVKDLSFSVEFHDLRKGERERANDIIKDFVRPFDLSKAPLIRLGIVLTDPDYYIFMLDMHHIITDDSSLHIFQKELTTLNRDDDPAPLEIQYKDYAVWQNSAEQKEELKKQEAYWLARFETAPPRFELPLDNPRSVVPGSANYINALIPAPLTKKLAAIAVGEDVTMFMVLLALYNLLLSKITGSDDIVIGTLAAGRSHSDLENIIGMFVNTLVLRNNVDGDISFKEFLTDVKKSTLEAFDNQDYQFDELVDRVVKKREPGRNPIFDAAFAYYGKHREVAGPTPKEDGTPYMGSVTDPAKFDFLMQTADKEDVLHIAFTYNSRLFLDKTIERMHGYFTEIVAQVAETPDIRIKHIKIAHDLAEAGSGVIDDEEGDFGF